MYGQLSNGVLIAAPSYLAIDGARVYEPTADQYAQAGYLPVEDVPPPGDGAYDDLSWTIADGRITAVWTAREPQEETSAPTTEDRLLAAEGTIQTHDREIDEIVTGLEALANG